MKPKQVGDTLYFTSGLPLAEIVAGKVVEILNGPTSEELDAPANVTLSGPERWCVATPDSPGVIVWPWQVVTEPAQTQDARDAAGEGQC
jgi:hypothetical protein